MGQKAFRIVLVLLGTVLFGLLVLFAMVAPSSPCGVFPMGLCADAEITQSASYWRGEAQPFAIVEHEVSSDGLGSLIVSNWGKTNQTLTITKISFDRITMATPITIDYNKFEQVNLSGFAHGEKGKKYRLGLNITYVDEKGVSREQIGLKALVGKYT